MTIICGAICVVMAFIIQAGTPSEAHLTKYVIAWPVEPHRGSSEFLISTVTVTDISIDGTVTTEGVTYKWRDTVWTDGWETRAYAPPLNYTQHSSPRGLRKVRHMDETTLILMTLTSVNNFALTLVMYTIAGTFETFQATPTSSWGRSYYPFAMQSSPVFIIVSDLATSVSVTSENRTLLRMLGQRGSPRTTGNTLVYSVASESSVAFDFCYAKESPGILLGVLVTSKRPVGVISGNCWSMTSMPAQDTAVKVNLSRNVLAEMLFPLKKLGTEYVTLSIFGRFDLGQYYIIASKDNTHVKVEWRLEDVALTFVLKQHEWRVIDRSGELAVITSSHPIQVTFVMDSVDMDHQLASHTYGPSLCVLVPPALHISSYLIASGKYSRHEIREWLAVSVKISPEDSYVRSTTGLAFGCYIFSTGLGFSYLYNLWTLMPLVLFYTVVHRHVSAPMHEMLVKLLFFLIIWVDPAGGSNKTEEEGCIPQKEEISDQTHKILCLTLSVTLNAVLIGYLFYLCARKVKKRRNKEMDVESAFGCGVKIRENITINPSEKDHQEGRSSDVCNKEKEEKKVLELLETESALNKKYVEENFRLETENAALKLRLDRIRKKIRHIRYEQEN